MEAGQRISVQRVLVKADRGRLDASSLLATVGAVFSFFLTAEFEFIVVALPLALAGLVLGLTRLRRVRAGQVSGGQPAAVGVALSAVCLGFCLAGIVVASMT